MLLDQDVGAGCACCLLERPLKILIKLNVFLRGVEIPCLRGKFRLVLNLDFSSPLFFVYPLLLQFFFCKIVLNLKIPCKMPLC